MIRRLCVVALLLATTLAPPPDPHLSARWDTATSATVQWTQAGRACLSVQHESGQGVFIACYDHVGTITERLGHVGPLDGAYRPMAGDTYWLTTNGQSYSASLLGRPQYLASFR